MGGLLVPAGRGDAESHEGRRAAGGPLPANLLGASDFVRPEQGDDRRAVSAVRCGCRFWPAPAVTTSRPAVSRPGLCARQDTIKRGGDKDLPALTDILKERTDLRLCIAGHVNFGQREADAMQLSTVGCCAAAATLGLLCGRDLPVPSLSRPCHCNAVQGRARQLRIRISSLGIPRERLDAIGFGYTKPRCASRRGAPVAKLSRVRFLTCGVRVLWLPGQFRGPHQGCGEEPTCGVQYSVPHGGGANGQEGQQKQVVQASAVTLRGYTSLYTTGTPYPRL